MYHRVIPRHHARRDSVEAGMFVTPATFSRHLAWLEAEFRVLPLHEIVDRIETRRALPARACAITFDDGWRDNYDYAFPELRRRALPATIFAVSERVGTLGAFWTDEICARMGELPKRMRKQIARRFAEFQSGDPVKVLLNHLKGVSDKQREGVLEALRREAQPRPQRRELLNWEELGRLSAGGVDIEAHGATHAILRGLSVGEIEFELRSSMNTLREHGYARHRLLAYPNGDHDADVRRIALEVGYKAAVTTASGLFQTDGDPMTIPRIGLHDDVSRTRAEFLYRLPRG